MIGTSGIQTVQNFENNLYDQLMRIDTPYCFVESESRRIGQVLVPKNIFEKMQKGTFLLLEAELSFRVQSLIEDYVSAENFKEGIENGMLRIKQYIDPILYTQLMELFETGSYEAFTELLLIKHYDPLYKKSIDSHNHQAKFMVNHYNQCALDIADWVRSSFHSE
jgi:tRNA 2-selenouridine synthase